MKRKGGKCKIYKKYFLGAVILSLAKITFAAPFVAEAPIKTSGQAITVSVSTSAWTKVNDATSLVPSRTAFRVTNPTSNTAVMYGMCKASAPTEAITVKINEIAKGSNITFPCAAPLDLYLLSVHTAAESAGVWEIGQ